MTARPRASTATHLPLPFPFVIKSLINLQGVAEKSFKYHGTSCMKCLDIFSIIYFSFVENINVALQKNSKLEGKWGSSQQFLFKLRCLALVKFEFVFFSPLGLYQYCLTIWNRNWYVGKDVRGESEGSGREW